MRKIFVRDIQTDSVFETESVSQSWTILYCQAPNPWKGMKLSIPRMGPDPLCYHWCTSNTALAFHLAVLTEGHVW